MYDIITMGSATVDVFAHTADGQSDVLKVHQRKDVCYPLGSKILITNLQFMTGGGGTNTAVAFSRLGFKTAYLGKIGKDANGQIILKTLKDEKITFIGAYGAISGYSVILDSVKEDRTIFTSKGCNNNLKFSEIKTNNLATKFFYFSSMMDASFKAQIAVATFCKKNTIPISFNPSLYMTKKGISYLRPILSQTTILIYNKEEAESLLHMRNASIEKLLIASAKLGPRIVAITDGHRGPYVYDALAKTLYHALPDDANIVETTGAGDAFAAGLVAGIIKKLPLDRAMILGMLNAESVIKYLGAKNVLLGKNAFVLALKDKRAIIKKKI